MEKNKEITFFTFENNGKKYVYDKEKITVEQAEIAKEVLEFKYNTFKNPPKELSQIFKSRSAEWSLIIMSYLLLEVNASGETQPFDIDKAQETEKFVKTLPIKFHKKLKDCATDFFTLIGEESIFSQVSSNEQRLSTGEILSTLLPLMMQKNVGNL